MQLENQQQTKTCLRCGRVRPLTDFYKNNQRKDGRTGNCRDCIAVLRKKWDKKYNQSEKARATARRYYYSEKGQKTKRAYRKQYTPTAEQRERYRAKRREQAKEPKYKAIMKRYWQSAKGKATKAKKDKRYRKTDKGRFARRKIEIKRKNRLKGAECTLTRKQWTEIKVAYKNHCAYCGRKMKRLEMDHVIPLAKGGHHTAQNIVPACRTCNAKKGTDLWQPETPEAFGQ